MTDEAFAERIVAMRATLYRVSCGILPRECDREDAVQASIEKAWRKRGWLRDERYMQTWVIRILINACHDIGRKYAREMPAELARWETSQDADGDARDLLLSLDDSLRVPAMLYYVERYEVSEIAHMLRLPAGTVKSRLHRAREKLRQVLGEEGLR